jgi:hypothetical protein
MCRAFVTTAFVVASSFFAGCGPGPFFQRNVTGLYSTPITATSPDGTRWSGSADILLTQTDKNLTGTIWIHHPAAGTIQVPIVSGIASDGQISFAGHGQFPMGTVDIAFQGSESRACIRGNADLTLHTFLGSATDRASFDLSKHS